MTGKIIFFGKDFWQGFIDPTAFAVGAQAHRGPLEAIAPGLRREMTVLIVVEHRSTPLRRRTASRNASRQGAVPRVFGTFQDGAARVSQSMAATRQTKPFPTRM
jgi:hypothetical protein